MDSRVIEVTDSAIENNRMDIGACGPSFFPKNAVGGPTKREAGVPVCLYPTGVPGPIKTDIPTRGNSGKPRWMFRQRGWVGTFYKKNGLIAGDKVEIRHRRNRTYELIPVKRKLRFIDLFAGIGGTRIAFEDAGCECVFSSEWDKFECDTYEANFGERPAGDIAKIPSSEIRDHDILVAGFPCQPFSISGVTKKTALGRPHGFKDPTQGTCFFEIKRILGEKRPMAFMLENVKHLKSHDKGRTYQVIHDSLEKELGYTVFEQVIDAVAYVPQHRERIFIVGFREPRFFTFPSYQPRRRPKFREILEGAVDPKYTLTDHLWNYLQDYAKKHKAKGNGFQYGLTDLDGHCRTISARYYKDGAEVLIPQQSGRNPRRLTPRECAHLMGFTKFRADFKIPVSDTQAYRQFGNSVVVPVVHAIAKRMVEVLRGAKGKGVR